MIRTSHSDPLVIAEVQANHHHGQIGLTLCPGKQQAHAATGAWQRDLVLDMAQVRRWGAAAVVSLIEEHEMEALGVPHLGNAVSAEHLVWHYLPIRDGSVPDAGFEEIWVHSGEELRAILRDGGNVLIHCKGGLGRAGLVAARLLVELGRDHDAAIAAVRSARPGAIETLAQLAHVQAAAQTCSTSTHRGIAGSAE